MHHEIDVMIFSYLLIADERIELDSEHVIVFVHLIFPLNIDFSIAL